jgi:tRNA(Ile2) C34 agmatinyltransferase TiaS
MEQTLNDDDDDTLPDCPACGGDAAWLGGLGRVTHYRCRACGIGFSTTTTSEDNDADET